MENKTSTSQILILPKSELVKSDRVGFDRALLEAEQGLGESGVPVGSSLVRGGELIASGRNQRVQLGDPIAHGEMNCLHRAGRQRSYRGMTLYTTLAPCMMCTGTILQFKIPRVVVGEAETFEGHLDFLVDHGVEVVLLDDEESKQLMREFIKRYPEVWAEDIAEPS